MKDDIDYSYPKWCHEIWMKIYGGRYSTGLEMKIKSIMMEYGMQYAGCGSSRTVYSHGDFVYKVPYCLDDWDCGRDDYLMLTPESGIFDNLVEVLISRELSNTMPFINRSSMFFIDGIPITIQAHLDLFEDDLESKKTFREQIKDKYPKIAEQFWDVEKTFDKCQIGMLNGQPKLFDYAYEGRALCPWLFSNEELNCDEF